MASKWDFVLEQKPVPLQAYLFEEVAKRLAADLQEFPPPIGELEEAGGGERFRELWEQPTRPGDDLYRIAFHLARLEVLREVEAIDDYMRNQRYKPAAPTPRDYLALIFLSRWLTENMLALKEALHVKVPRERLARCLEDAERLLLGSRTVV